MIALILAMWAIVILLMVIILEIAYLIGITMQLRDSSSLPRRITSGSGP